MTSTTDFAVLETNNQRAELAYYAVLLLPGVVAAYGAQEEDHIVNHSIKIAKMIQAAVKKEIPDPPASTTLPTTVGVTPAETTASHVIAEPAKPTSN